MLLCQQLSRPIRQAETMPVSKLKQAAWEVCEEWKHPEWHEGVNPDSDILGYHARSMLKALLAFAPRVWTPAAVALFAYAHKAGMNYSQDMKVRMIGVLQKIYPPAVPKWADCSSFVTWCYFVAGRPDPNNSHYNGYGYTGSLILNGSKVSRYSMKSGDLVFYGTPVSHVAIYVGNGKVISHGQQGGPYLLPYNYRSLNQVRRYA